MPVSQRHADQRQQRHYQGKDDKSEDEWIHDLLAPNVLPGTLRRPPVGVGDRG